MTSPKESLSRAWGGLAHISSLPGAGGIGTMGPESEAFLDLLRQGKARYWQILPLGPTSPAFGHSPYSATSAFAGNPLLINLESVQSHSWCPDLNSSSAAAQESGNVDFAAVRRAVETLKIAWDGFNGKASPAEKEKLREFRRSQSFWIEDYALFAVLSRRFRTGHWPSWPAEFRFRNSDALSRVRAQSEGELDFEIFLQFLFETQWSRLRRHASEKEIRIIGDLPIYVNMDSADTWSNPHIFDLDPRTLSFNHVAGVPPDYFSPTGQLWGNPLYKWMDSAGLVKQTMDWWARRIGNAMDRFDVIRLDHFRGFSGFWSVPACAQTAASGKWEQGPGIPFFREMEKRLGPLPVIAEDLGEITPDVEKMRREFQFPGMRVLQFAFDGNSENIHLPHNFESQNTVVYTGTHDNNTLNGWYYGSENSERTREYIRSYLNVAGPHDMHLPLIRLAFQSVANLAIIPVQDILGFGAECRMNLPGKAEGNWLWKWRSGQLSSEHMKTMARISDLYGRS